MAHECRASTSRAEVARSRMACLQSAPVLGIAIWPTMSSTIPSRIWPLLATCL